MKFDIPKLEKYFGAPIAQTVGNTSSGVYSLKEKMAAALAKLDDHGMPMLSYWAAFDDAINAVAEKIDVLKIEEYSRQSFITNR